MKRFNTLNFNIDSSTVKKTFIVVTSLMLFASLGCESTPKTEPSTTKSWGESMQDLAQNLKELAPYLFSRKEYNDQKNSEKIKRFLNSFEGQSAHIPTHLGEEIVGKDPLLKLSLTGLKSQLQQARKAYDSGYLEVSRNLLRASTSYCFSCHSTQNIGPQNTSMAVRLPDSFDILPTEKADFYVATRNFDEALKTLADFLLEGTSLKPQNNTAEQLFALKKYILLQVRVKNNPNDSIKLLVNASTQKSTPEFMKSVFKEWVQSLTDWSNRTPVEQKSIGVAKLLINRARQHDFISRDSGYVDYVLATKALHEELLVASKAQHKSEVYELLGKSYLEMPDMEIGELPEIYLEACVRGVPKTMLAKRCYKEFERIMVLNYANSLGIDYTEEDRARLNDLRALSGL